MSEPVLKTSGLCKHFLAIQVCRDLHLSVKAGELHALIGPNGAGKTTVLNLISGLLAPDGGKIFLKGQDISNAPVHHRARLGLARAFQVTSLFNSFTVLENLSIAVQAHLGKGFHFWSNAARDRQVCQPATAVMERMGLEDRRSIKAGNLSHGERRQLEMGMALATRPSVLLLDEPMAGLGPGGSLKLAELINDLKGEITILLVEHDMKAVFSLADCISVLVQGKVVATDTPDAIRKNTRVQEAYLGGA